MLKQVLKYQIQHEKLENGVHQFDYQVDGALFSRFENEEIQGADLKVTIDLKKNSEGFTLFLSAIGEIELQCDRCLDFFSHPLEISHEVIVKLDDKTDFDTDHDFVCLDRTCDSIDVSYFIYEMVIVNLPIRRVHPEDENGESLCNPEIVKYIAGESLITEEDAQVIEEAESNENWKEDLKNLLNN